MQGKSGQATNDTFQTLLYDVLYTSCVVFERNWKLKHIIDALHKIERTEAFL